MGVIEKHEMRLTALEARCHELEHDGAKGVQSQIAALQERVGRLESARPWWSETRQAPTLDDHRDSGRPGKPAPPEHEIAIPDVPVSELMLVGTFGDSLRAHMRELAGGYSWGASHPLEWTDDYLARMAGVARAIGDAYELARTGEHKAAEDKLREIEW